MDGMWWTALSTRVRKTYPVRMTARCWQRPVGSQRLNMAWTTELTNLARHAYSQAGKRWRNTWGAWVMVALVVGGGGVVVVAGWAVLWLCGRPVPRKRRPRRPDTARSWPRSRWRRERRQGYWCTQHRSRGPPKSCCRRFRRPPCRWFGGDSVISQAAQIRITTVYTFNHACVR